MLGGDDSLDEESTPELELVGDEDPDESLDRRRRPAPELADEDDSLEMLVGDEEDDDDDEVSFEMDDELMLGEEEEEEEDEAGATAPSAGVWDDDDGGIEVDSDFDEDELEPEPAVTASALVDAPRPATSRGVEAGIDLKPDQQMGIDVAFDGIENKSFYEILLLPRTADARAIKRAYYRLSKEYHPDKFYRKTLGSYKDKLEVIFGKINEAYRVLSDEEAREDYDLLVFGEDGKDAASPTESTLEVTFQTAAERKKDAAKSAKAKLKKGGKRRKKKQQAKFLTEFQKQLAMRIAKARRHMTKGEEAMEKGEQAEAARHFQAAMALDPRNTKAKTLYRRMTTQDRNSKAEVFWKQSRDAMLAEDHKRAAELLQKAVECKPTKGKYYNEFGKLVSAHTLQQKVGLELLRKAVELESRNLEFCLDLARAYEELGMPSNAQRAFERVLQIKPKHSEATKALKRLK